MTSDTGFASLQAHAARLRGLRTADLLAREPGRVTDLALRCGPLYVNFARQGYDREALDALFALARKVDVAGGLRALFDGEKVNPTEGRAALHTALRGDLSDAPAAREAHAVAREARVRMAALVAALESSEVTDIVSIGIGGSDLGPKFVADALRGAEPGRFRVHFVSNVDGGPSSARWPRWTRRIPPAS